MICKAIRKLRKLPRIFSLNLSVPSQSSYFFKLSKSSYVSFKYVMTLQFFIVGGIRKCASTLNFWKKFKFVLKDDCGGSMVNGIKDHSGWGLDLSGEGSSVNPTMFDYLVSIFVFTSIAKMS